MEAPFKYNFPQENYCYKCGSNTIELFDLKNRPMRYGECLKMYKDNKILMNTRFDRTVLDHFKCITCNKIFKINWVMGYPTPLEYKI